MLTDLIKSGFGQEEDLNCAETILYGANKAYNLGLSRNALKLAAAFGGGMAIEDKCGALIAALMAMGNLFVEERAHESSRIKELSKEFFSIYEKKMGSIDCAPLKENYRNEDIKCYKVILKSAEILDMIVKRETA